MVMRELDPEGLFYMARHLAHLGEIDRAIDLFLRIVERGFCCYPAMQDDSWLDPVRARPEFVRRLRQAEARHRQNLYRTLAPNLPTFES
jgi:pentatricopeptide repeat protein